MTHELIRQLLAILIHWSPGGRLVSVGDGGYGTHALARVTRRHCRHRTLVSRFYANVQLYEPTPAVVDCSPPPRAS